ncbi:hypothetical protein [Lentzea sp. NPDC060358]|uniref:hypothetical protein n=1 Tax=Lentzea sp. NPDC060358 TaxID=3347103 RepID=UPI0036614610
MKNMPIILSDRRLMLTELPTLKTREVDGHTEIVTDKDGAQQFVVSLFMKAKGEKGEEVKVTLGTDPGDGFDEGDIVDLVDPRASFYSFKNGRGETVSGIAYRAMGLTKIA